MERQHAEGRGRRDRGGFSAFLGRAFPGRTAGADLLALLHETFIIIRNPSCRESPAKYKLFTFHASLDFHPKVVRQGLRLALLPPDLTRAALEAEATIELKRIPKSLPLSWREQHRSIG
jgi:hypothetical protein